MPLCPRCGKKFKCYSNVARHLSQPLSFCASLTNDPFTDPQQLPPLIAVPQASVIKHPSPLANVMDDDPMDSQTFEDFETPFNSAPLEHIDLGTPVQDDFPGAAATFDHGPTFMDKFDHDQHADKRHENIYYPFASRKEWQLASFLLSSGMSMGQIDKFLSLKLVCESLFLRIHAINTISRSPSYHSLSSQPRN